jgi:hypothetical protein
MTNNKQHTAVEWLIEQLRNNENIRWRGTNIIELGEQAKEMEKEQMIDAWSNGFDEDDRATCNPLNYYKQTYGGDQQ